MSKDTAPAVEKLLARYECGPVQFKGRDNALYERDRMFDNVIDPATAKARDRYEAAARSVRDILAQRWVRTDTTYERENPKRVYYLSMEFLIGRSLANNVMNLLLDPLLADAAREKGFDWLGLVAEGPDPGLRKGGLGEAAGVVPVPLA